MESYKFRWTLWDISKAYKFRVYLKKEREKRLDGSLWTAKLIYNRLLDHKMNKYKKEKMNIGKYSMYPIVKQMIKENEAEGMFYSQVLVSITDRLDRSFQNFFRRVKENKHEKKHKSGLVCEHKMQKL